jgi:phosphomannomutase/phosphoglucomutase
LITPTIFRAYDIRGVVDQDLTEEAARLIGQALAGQVRAAGLKEVAVGRDGRLSGPRLQQALMAGLMAGGCDVIDVGQVPTPVLYFATHHLGTGSGVVVTGSHNPPDYNGLKMVVNGTTLAESAIQQLRSDIEAGELPTGTGQLRSEDVLPAYRQRIVGDTVLSRGLKVVVDCGNGVTGDIAPALIRELGCDVVELFTEVDGNFPNHHPDPSKPENLVDLIAAVAEHEADLGLAFDGDGDRVGVVTPTGDVIWPDRLMMMFARDLLQRNPGATILYDVKCTRHLPAVIKQAGGNPVMCRTGHSLVKAELKAQKAALAGEMSGHIFFGERWYGFDDGLYGACRLLEIISKDSRPVQALFDELPDAVNTPELHIEMAEGEPHALIPKLIEAANFDDAQVATLDGIRVDFSDGFGLARASNTTPVMVLRFEGDDQAALERITGQFRDLFQRVVPEIDFPL